MKRFAGLLVCLCFLQVAARAGNVIDRLLKLDKTVRSDSIVLWYKNNIRHLDSAKAIPVLNELKQKSVAANDKIGTATAFFVKGLYYDEMLHNAGTSKYYLERAIAMANKGNMPYEWAAFTFQLGMFYFYHDEISASIECLLRANDKFREIGYNKISNARVNLYNMGYVYYHLHNYRESLHYLLEAAKYPYSDTWVDRQIPNTTGLAYMQLGMYDDAIRIFNTVLEASAKAGDTLWMGVASGNIGEVYMRKKAYDEALPYLEKNYLYTKSGRKPDMTDITGNIINALVSMADIYIIKGDRAKAAPLLKEAVGLWPETERSDYWRQSYLYETMARLSALDHDFTNAYNYLQLSKKVGDSTTRRDDALRYTYVQQQLQSEKHRAQINVFLANQKIAAQRRKFLGGALVLLGVLVWLAYNRYRLKVKKDREIRIRENRLLQSEKLRVEEDLENARRLLEQYLASIAEKNDLIDDFKAQLSKATVPDGLEQISPLHFEYLEQLAGATLLTDDEWDKFKVLFEKVHKGFFVRLRHRAPELTEAEIRLFALIKLNIPNKQMAQMLGISPASVHTARYRLRKKIALPEDALLEELN